MSHPGPVPSGGRRTAAGQHRVPVVVAVGVLGSLRVVCHGQDLTPTAPKLRQFLAVLATSPNQVVRLETLVAELWGTEPTERHLRTVQTYVSQLRKTVTTAPLPGCPRPPMAIAHVPRVGYSLAVGPGGLVDLARFHRTVERAGADDRPDGLLVAVAQFRGTPLADVPLGPVLADQQRRIEVARVAVLERYLRSRLERDEPEAVVAEAERIRAVADRHTAVHAHLVRALAELGRAEESREYAERIGPAGVGAVVVAAGVGVPEPAVGRAADHRPGTPAAPVAPAAPRTIAPPSPAGAVASTGPAADDTEPPPRRPDQVPVDPRPFVGYADQLAAAAASLCPAEPGPGDAPVLAVVGGPGSGKTAFTTRLAENVDDAFPDGRLHTHLRHSTVTGALASFLRALGVGTPPESEAERTRLFRALTTGRRLLVVVDGADAPEAATALRPGPGGNAMVVATAVRPTADRATAVLELRPMTPAEQRRLFDLRVGPERAAREPEQVGRALACCHGLPLAVDVLTSRVLLRPHWTLDRLAARARAAGSAWSAGRMDLADSVDRVLALLTPDERATATRLLRDPGSAAPFTAAQAAEILDRSELDTEDLCERLVDIRLAAVAGHCAGPSSPCYRVHPLYRATTGG